ncbi:matrix-remodeling-associated protein 5-like [Polymixia lowei]
MVLIVAKFSINDSGPLFVSNSDQLSVSGVKMYRSVCMAVAVAAVLVLVLAVPMGRACPRTCNCYQANEVHCTFRSLLAVPPGLPAHTQRINLGFNSINRIPDSSLAGLKKVELLMLHGNDLHKIPDGAFRDMKSLQVLKLSYNKLKEISSSLTFSGLTSLVRLHLDHNLLQYIHPRALLQLPSLRLLRLQGNRLHQLHPHSLCTMSLLNTYYYSTLRHLDLSNNSLTTLPRETLVTAPLLETLILQANPWSCDCRMSWFLSWSLTHPGLMKCPRGPQCPVCASPGVLQGRDLLQQADLSCASPVISSQGRDAPSEADLGEIQPIESFREPLGAASLSLSDQQGNSVDLSCSGARSTNSPDIAPPPDLSLSSSAPLSLAPSIALDCPVERGSYERLWRILAYYSETAVRLEREIMLSKAPELAYRYRQAVETEGYYHTGVKASVKAKPHWLLQPAISIQLNRAQSSGHRVQLILTTRVSARPDPVSHTLSASSSSSSSSSSPRPWVLISTNHTATAVAAVTGRRVELSCPLLSSGKPTLQWILPDGSKIISPSSSPDGRLRASASVLLLQRAELSDAGLYHCVARAGSDVDVLPLRLAVEESSGPPPGEQMGPSVTALVGKPVNLPCEASGSPTPDISWVLPDGNIMRRGSALSGGVIIQSNGSLSLPHPSLNDVGQYRCMVVNQYGADSLSMWLDFDPRPAPPLRTSFPRGPQSAAGRSTRIRAPLLRETIVLEASGDEEEDEEEEEEEEEEKKIPIANKRRPRPPQPPLNRRYPVGHPRRRGPVRGGPLRRVGGASSSFEQRRNRFDNRHRVGATKQRIDPQKWADLLAKIRQRTLNTTSQPITEQEPTAEPFDRERNGEAGRNTDTMTSTETQTDLVTSKPISKTNEIESEPVEGGEREPSSIPSRTRPQNPRQGAFPNLVPNSRPQSPWNSRRRIGQRRRIINRPRGRPLTPPRPLPLPDPATPKEQTVTPDTATIPMNTLSLASATTLLAERHHARTFSAPADSLELIPGSPAVSDSVTLSPSGSPSIPESVEIPPSEASTRTPVRSHAAMTQPPAATEETERNLSGGASTTIHIPTARNTTPIPTTTTTTIPTTTTTTTSTTIPTTTTTTTSTTIIPTTTKTTTTATTIPTTTTTTPSTATTTSKTTRTPITSTSSSTAPTTTTSTSTRGSTRERPSPGLFYPRGRPVSGVPNQSRPSPDWRNPGANSIPDSHGTRPRPPSSPSLPASPGAPVVRSRPRIADPHIRTVSVPAESTARLACEAQGEPKPAITWTKVSTGAVMSVNSRAQRFEVLPNGTFVIQNVQLQDRGTYICSAHSSLGRDRMLTTLEVWSRPPRMQLANYREATIHQGGEVRLDCQADGVPTPVLSWVLPDRSVLTSTGSSHSRMTMHTNGTLHIWVTSPSDRGVYRCVASNSAGAASTSVRVHVSSLPPVIHQAREERLVLIPGMPVYAHCTARGAPPPTLRWRIPDGTLVRPSQFLHGNLFVLPNGTLHIRNVGPKDSGSYECTANNAVGADKRTVRVELQGGSEGHGRQGGRVGGVSSTLHKDSTSSHPFPSSNPLHPTRFSPPSPFNRSRTSPLSPSSPRLPSVDSKPAGSPDPPLGNDTAASPSSPLSPSIPTNNSKFSRPGASGPKPPPSFPANRGRGSSPSALTPVSSLSKARIISTSPSVTSVHYGDSLQLHCSVSGNPPPTIIWRTPNRKLVDVHFSFDRRLKVHANGSLSVQAVTERDAGDYLCIARNKVADDYRLLRISVATKPAKIEPKQPSNQMVSFGGQLKVDCLASGLPDPAVHWSLPDGTMVNSVLQGEERGGRARRLTVFDNGTLLVPAVGMAEEGEYTCYAENQGGQDTMKVKVKVMMTSPPTFTDDRSYDVFKVRQGVTAALRCRATGDPAPTVTWFSPNNRVIPRSLGSGSFSERVVVVSDGTLEIRAAQRNDAGNYTCQASNTAGKRSKVVGLEVEVPYHIGVYGRGRSTGVISRSASSDGTGTSRVRGSVLSRSSDTGGASSGTSQTVVNRKTSAANTGTSASHASNSAGTAVSVTTTVKQRVVRGQTVILPCPSHGSPPPRLAWLLPGNGVLPAPYYGSRLTVYRNGSLELRGARDSDAGTLVCVVRGDRGETRIQVELAVSGTQEEAEAPRREPAAERPAPRGPFLFESPRSGVPPTSPDSVRSLVPPPPPPLPETLRPRSPVTEKPPQRGPFSPAPPQSISPPLRSGGPVSEPVTSRQQPVVSTRTASLVSIINGENLRLPCHAPTAPGYAQGPLSWTLPSGDVVSRGESAGSGRYSVLEDGTLMIKQTSVFDRGSYSCRSTNHDSSLASVVTVPVIVIAYPPRITTGPSPVTYTRPGVAVELPCLTIATPRATVTWETPDLSQLRVTGQARIYGNRYLSAQGSLVIQNPTSRDTGFYRCTAKNVIGADTKATYLHVI